VTDRDKQSGGQDRCNSSKEDEQSEQGGCRPEEGPGEARSADGRLVEWFGKWRKPIRSWLRNRASVPPGDIDDLAQEVFLRLLRYSDEVAVENPQGYLFRIAANVANEWRERSRVRKPHDDTWLDELQIEAGDEPENAIAKTRANEYVQAAVDRLPPRQREVLLLHVNEGLTYKQIAQQRGLTYRIVLRDLTRAYSTLRMQLRLEDL
jgi:RNA polymerase sigma factor (sigma-70 family)